MKVLVTGGTGFVGQRLVKRLYEQGHEAVIVTRDPQKARQKEQTPASFVGWDYKNEDFPKEGLEGIDAIVHLMGENISSKRWSDSQKEKIRSSRVLATQKLVEACEKYLESPLQCFISGSAIGYYPANTNESFTEEGKVGQGFLPEVCKDWEEEAKKLTKSKRLIISRTGVVLGPESGALNKLLPIFKLGAGGPIGSGSMIMSWIHVEDMVSAIIAFLEKDQFNGIYNMVAPNPASNKEFTKAIANAVKRPAIFPVPPFMLKVLFGEMSSIILDSQTVVPANLQKDGFQFKHPHIEEALEDLVGARKDVHANPSLGKKSV